jgi:hypothetical protein
MGGKPQTSTQPHFTAHRPLITDHRFADNYLRHAHTGSMLGFTPRHRSSRRPQNPGSGSKTNKKKKSKAGIYRPKMQISF